MKDISIYFKPVSEEVELADGTIGASAFIHDQNGFPEIKQKGIALIYVPEFRNSETGAGSNDAFRKTFYHLNVGDGWNGVVYDLGTITPGEAVEDTYFALSQAIAELIKKNVLPIVIGGGQDLIMACYKAFEELEQMINICSIDSRLDVGSPESTLQSDAFVSHLLMQRPCYLFNYATIGVQRPYVGREEFALFDQLYFDICRLGAYNQDARVAEPYLRNSDLIGLDFSSIRCGDTDPSIYPNPNGFYADQICQIAHYAGISDKVNCFGIFNVSPEQNNVSSTLLAEVIWYFIDGVFNRLGDFPVGSRKNYKKFHVHMEDFDEDLIFYKSNRSDRWWLEVKYPAGEEGRYERHQLVPCNRSDYEGAMENKIPNLWWKTLQKLS